MTMKRISLTVLILFALGHLIGSPNALAADPAAQSSPVIIRCDQPFMFGFGSWEKAKTDFPTRPDGIHISAVDARGGAGVAGLNLNLADHGDWTPALTLAVGEQNIEKPGTMEMTVGHIPYGQGNEGNAMSRSANGWVQQWLLNFGPAKKMVPNWFDWPVNEQYIDFAIYPLHNENCFNQTTVPAACYWFYVHSRPEARK